METIHIERKDIERIVNATFPSYNGRRFKIMPGDTVRFTDLNWSGGSRSQYSVCSLDGSRAVDGASLNHPAPWDNAAEGKTIDIPVGVAVVEHSMFCGKDMGLTVHVRRDDMAPLLPAPVELTDYQKTVLIATRNFKSSYAERSRFQHTNEETGISRADWDNATVGLIARRLLNKAGAITNAGRNAIGEDRFPRLT